MTEYFWNVMSFQLLLAHALYSLQALAKWKRGFYFVKYSMK